MIRNLRRRFALACAAAGPAGAGAFWALSGWKTALAFLLTFLLVAGDFLWMSMGIERVLGGGPVPPGATRILLLGLLLRTLLLLFGVYAILRFLPRESLGVILGIGGPLMLLAVAGAAR
jgi:hypothetical protein